MSNLKRENCKLKLANEYDLEWTIEKQFDIYNEEKSIGYIKVFLFSKKTIIENIEDDFAYYMDEDTHMKESVANFILDTIEDKECVYISDIYIEKDYRNKGIGTKAISILKEKYKDKYIVLFASALDSDDKTLFIKENQETIDKFLNKLDYFYKKQGFKNDKNIYYLK